MQNIRNFVIIAHIDHGKSTLADRLLELTGTIEKRKMQEQLLDQMSIERERGITIKMAPVRMNWKNPDDNKDYILNLIDTPGHVDFSYEVSRALLAVEGAILLVDATQGIQAQTIYNLEKAQKQGLTIIPAINKIDLVGARTKETKEELAKLLSINQEEIFEISAKTGLGVLALLKEVIKKVPSPSFSKVNLKNQGDDFNFSQALIFDSKYDAYKGVIVFVRVFNGQFSIGKKIKFFAKSTEADILEVGVFNPELKKVETLSAGEIGYLATGLKEIESARVGDTVFSLKNGDSKNDNKITPLAGYEEPKPMVFASFYAEEEKDFDILSDSLSKLKLNDASLSFEQEYSEALGRGFRCGFLGMLHLEIVLERLKREYGSEPIATLPSVVYKAVKTDGKEFLVYTPSKLPDNSLISAIFEPYVKLEIITPSSYLGPVMKLLGSLRVIYKTTTYITNEKVVLSYEAPLSEIIIDFYDKLKSATSGYASLNYEIIEFRQNDLVRLDILVANEIVPAFSRIVFAEQAEREGRFLVEKLKDVLPKQLFAVALQAAVFGKIVARETISALRKDVTGYLYGGDVTRKNKLLDKQKRGKKKMKAMGKVNIPQKTFLEILKR